jgi:tripartite-type tricarboxylate transporter receptor subunit TctC
MMKSYGIGSALFAIAIAVPIVAIAQTAPYPVKPVRVIVPFPAGGPVETLARVFTQRLTETLGQPFVIDNRPGASGTLGSDLVAKAPRDGYTMLVANCSHTGNAAYYKKLPYDTANDFAPITQVDVTSGNLMVVHPSVPARTVKEFIAFAKARPAQLNYASAGVGSPQHVSGAVFASMAGINLVHVPYKGNPQAFTDTIGGHIEVMFVTAGVARPYLPSGRLRALGIAGPRRLPTLNDVPTIQEAGLPDYNVICWHGMFFPAGTPADIVRRVNGELLKALATPEARRYMADNDYFATGTTPEELQTFVREDLVLQANLAKMVGIQPQ